MYFKRCPVTIYNLHILTVTPETKGEKNYQVNKSMQGMRKTREERKKSKEEIKKKKEENKNKNVYVNKPHTLFF